MVNEAVIIAGALDATELERSIDNIINTISSKSENMATPFTNAIGKMEQAMKNFAITQKVSASTMKDAWREMSTSFDAMVAAQSASIGGGNGSGNAHATNTIGALEQEIAEIKKERKEMELNSNELRTQNSLLERRKNLYKEQTTSPATKRLDNAMQMSTNKLDEAQKKLRLLEILQRRYANTTELSVAQQNKLARAIQQTKNQIDKIKPKSLREVLGMDANSIDQIAAKMRALKNVQIDPKNADEVKKVGDAYAKLKREQAQLMGQNIQMTHSNNYLAQSFGYIRNRIVYALTLGAITSFTKQIYEIRGQYELLERSLGVLVNSFERGSQIFQELNEMAIKSPFTLMELAGAAKQLTAYNFTANEVVDTTRRLADISAALGVPMERLTYNLGQIRAQTVLTARDARDFANAGLPIVASLADHFTELEGKVVTTGDVYDRMSKKMVSYSDVMSVLNKMTDEGGKFFDFQAKQAETLRVQMANLNLAWNNMLNDIGKSNQGLLTLPISGLKALLQNWQTIDRVLKSMLYTFIGWKALQMVAIRQQWAWATATGATAKQMGWLANGIKAVGASLASLAANPWTWVFVGIMAIIDLVRQTNAAREAIHELNQEIRDNANEASESLLNYLNNKGNKSTLELAKQNKLTAEQGERAWESLKQQIEQSALSANSLIAELQAIPDINERVATSFDYAERIQKAQAALQDLKEDSIKVNQDYTFLGIGEEGLATDLQDYANYIEKYSQIAKEYNLAGEEANKWIQSVEVVKGARQEFLGELDETAESINNFIRAYNITDPLQINEILERVKAQIKAKNPEIKGEAAKIFDISLDQKMAELTNGAVDRNASLWNMFMERLKNNSSSAFQDINDDWIKHNKKLSKEQKAAIDANLKYFKDSMPYAYDAVAKMVKDASKLRIQIGITFGGSNSTPFQKEVQKRMAQHPILDYGNFAPTANDDLNSWVKTQQEAIKKLKEENKLYARDNSKWSKQKIKDNNSEIEQRKNNLDLFHQQYQSEKDADAARRKADAERRKRDKAYKKDVNDIASAIKDEISLINDMRNNYEKLRNAGVSSIDAIDISTRGYSNTILRLNNIFKKFGIKEFNAKDFAGKDIHGLLNALTKQRNDILASGKVKTQSIKDLDVEIQKLQIEAKTYDMKKITDGLNNELGKLKDEYELAVELDANPEVGNAFANMMGINTESLPHTVKEYVDRYATYLNKYLKAKNSSLQFTGDELLGLTRDDITAFREQVNAGTFNQEWFDAIKKAYDDIQGKRKKDIEDTEKWKNSLIEKYGNLQDKLTKIYKDSIQQQVNAVKSFGTEDQKSDIVRLQLKLEATDDPAELADINLQIAEIVKDVTDKNPIALKVVTSSKNQKEIDTSKAYWDDFKNSELYTMTFEDMANNSTRAIQLIMEKLDGLKDKVKEDPASMKALTKSLEDAQKELNTRDPFGGVAKSLRQMAIASKEAKTAQEALLRAEDEVEQAQQEVDNAENGTPEEQAAAQQKLADAVQRRAAAQVKLTQAENKGKKAQENLKSSLQGIADQLGNVKSLFDTVSKLFRAGGDDETADAIDAISEGFSVMTTVIMGVVAAMILLEASQPWLLAIAAALSVIVGLVSFLSGNSNKKITKKVEESERAVKRLELAYIDLEHAVKQAFGMATIGANMAAKANKELQLLELKRQLALERSRDSKDRDEDKIIDLQKQIKELEYDIADTVDNIVNDLLGVSSVGDAMENMMDAFVEALRSGDDAMAKFNENVDEMIANMVKKMYVTKILQPWFEEQWNKIQSQLTERAGKIPEELAKIQSKTSIARSADTTDNNSLIEALRALGMSDEQIHLIQWYDEFGHINRRESNARLKAAYEKMLKEAEQKEAELQKELTAATTPSTDDMRQYAELLRSGQPIMEENMQEVANFLRELGLMKDDANKNLSNLQAGISGVTEDTASALEAYMNGVSQQVYYQSSLLEQIRDSVVGLDLDVSLGVQSQMLLQLQNSYQTQQAIKQILEGVLTPSGRAFSVELLS